MDLSRVAAKRLTPSDLTIFSSHFHRPGQRSKQKAINLNADVFVDKFYPALRNRFAEHHFGITIVGPGTSPPYTLSRKALRPPGGKNWRLNGELIGDPADQPGRFDQLQEGDLAILAFDGDEKPERVAMLLLSQDADAELCELVTKTAGFQGRHTMRPLSSDEMQSMLHATRAHYEDIHPLEFLLQADSIEEAIYGPAETHAQTTTNGLGVPVSPDGVRRQVSAASEVGAAGEEAFREWLLAAGHPEDSFEWVSQSYARAAYDFRVDSALWEPLDEPAYVDVKATRVGPEAPLHMSRSEVRWAAQNDSYRIARITLAPEGPAKIQILGAVSAACCSIQESLADALPTEAQVDSLQLSPALFKVVHEAYLELNQEEI